MNFISRLKDTKNSFARYLKKEIRRWKRNLVVAVNRMRRLAFWWSDLPKYVVIFQMGKVGSQSIKSLMKQSYGHRYVLHNHIYDSAEIFRDEGKKLSLVALTRMPLDHAVSVFFQAFHLIILKPSYPHRHFHFPRLYKAILSGPLQRLLDGNLTLDELRGLFLNEFEYDASTFSGYRWFDDQIKEPFGIDVYAKSFAEDGYEEYRNGGTRLLVMKYELDDLVKLRLLGDFFKLWVPWEMPRVNETDRHPNLGELYRRFKREVKLPKEYVERACESRYFKHFYTPAEIEQQRRKWSE